MSSGESRAAGVAPYRAPRAWIWILGSALVLGLVRFLGLDAWGLWVDEAHTLHDALSGRAQAFPLGYFATRASLRLGLGGTGELGLRLFPALAGWASIGLAYWAFAPSAGRLRAAVVALLLALSSWHVFWSQSARAYTLAQALALVGGGLYLRGLLQPSTRKLLAGFLVGGCAAFAHPSAALLLPAWIAAALLPFVRRRLAVRGSRSMLVVLGAALFIVLGGWALGVWKDYLDAKAGTSLPHFVLTAGYYVTPALGLGALVGARIAVRRGQALDLLVLSICALVLTLAAAASAVVLVSAQYVFVLQPWIALLASAPLAAWDDGSPRLRGARAGYLALLVLPLALDTALYFGVRHGDRPRWREAYAYVWNRRGPDDLVLGMAAPVGEYYLAPGRTNLRSPRALVRLNDGFAYVPGLWSRQGRRTWFVVNHEDLQAWRAVARERFEEMLAEECRLEARFTVRGTPRDLDVSVYSR